MDGRSVRYGLALATYKWFSTTFGFGIGTIETLPDVSVSVSVYGQINNSAIPLLNSPESR